MASSAKRSRSRTTFTHGVRFEVRPSSFHLLASLRLTFAPGTPAPKVTLVQGGATIDGPRVR